MSQNKDWFYSSHVLVLSADKSELLVKAKVQQKLTPGCQEQWYSMFMSPANVCSATQHKSEAI